MKPARLAAAVAWAIAGVAWLAGPGATAAQSVVRASGIGYGESAKAVAGTDYLSRDFQVRGLIEAPLDAVLDITVTGPFTV
jgi:hypothetical protein